MRPSLILFVKEPRPGRVKTRLSRDIGPIAAAWWQRHQIAAHMRRLGADRRWSLFLSVSPDTARHGRILPGGAPRLAQGPGDLGRRMSRALAAVPPGPVLLIGGDIPAIRPVHLAQALSLARRHGTVLGPTPDGGFWLIGLRRGGPGVSRALLDGIRWSAPDTLAQTARRLGSRLNEGPGDGRAALADLLTDVDCAADLHRAARG